MKRTGLWYSKYIPKVINVSGSFDIYSGRLYIAHKKFKSTGAS